MPRKTKKQEVTLPLSLVGAMLKATLFSVAAIRYAKFNKMLTDGALSEDDKTYTVSMFEAILIRNAQMIAQALGQSASEFAYAQFSETIASIANVEDAVPGEIILERGQGLGQ